MAATHKENTSLLQNRGASMVISPEKRGREGHGQTDMDSQ
jgi:hypothetical protein